MKKVVFCSLAAIGMLSFASCSSREDGPVAGGDGVYFTIELPGHMNSRGTFGDGTDAGDRAILNNLQWTVFEVGTDGTTLTKVFSDEKTGAFAGSQTQETVMIPLAKGKTYQVAFYADDATNSFCTYADGDITVDYANGASNTAAEDAFIGKSAVFTVTGAYNETVTLTRPYAQLNWGTNDLDAKVLQNIIPSLTAQVSVKSGLFTKMNVIGGGVSDPVTDISFAAVELAADKRPGQTFPVEGTPAYALIAMNYLLTGEGTVDCELAFNNGLTAVTVNAAPVKVNYRTNIYGQLLTAPGNFNILVDNNFNSPDLEPEVAEVATADDFVAALASPYNQTIKVAQDLDLTAATMTELTFDVHKTIDVAEGATIKLGNTNKLVANNGLTLTGAGTITNVTGDNTGLGQGVQKTLIQVNGGDLNVDGLTLINDPDYHWHGANGAVSSTILYANDANVTVKNAHVTSGLYALCGLDRSTDSGNIVLDNSVFESTSSNKDNGTNWAYTVKVFGTTATITNCTITGVQGALSIDGRIEAVIDGGTYSTHNSAEGVQDAFYALYVTNGTKTTIKSGNFSAPNKRTGFNIEGTSCVVSGDNDINLELGSLFIEGGNFSGKAYNMAGIVELVSPFTYEALTGQDPYVWTVVK